MMGKFTEQENPKFDGKNHGFLMFPVNIGCMVNNGVVEYK